MTSHPTDGLSASRMMQDLFRLSEGDGDLCERFTPGAGAYRVEGKSFFGESFRLSDAGGQDYRVAVVQGDRDQYLVTRHEWVEGVDAWERSGRPMAPERQPRFLARIGTCVPLSAATAQGVGFVDALRRLHSEFMAGRRSGDNARLEALDGMERAMLGIRRSELKASGMPDWLLAPSEDEPEADAGPRP